MKKKANPLGPLLVAIRDLLAWFRSIPVRGVLIGGVATSLLGRPRVTKDVDALVFVETKHWQSFLNKGIVHGFEPRIPDPIAFARETRVLLLVHQPSGVQVDISLGALPFEEETISRARKKKVQGIALPLATPEDLIVMKALAHRPRDIADIEGLLDTQAKLDLGRVRRWTRMLTDILDTPEYYENLECLLANKKPARKKKK